MSAPTKPAPPAAGQSGERAGRPADRARALATRHAHWLIALVAYAALAIALTWPVAIDPAGRIVGGPGDATGQIALTEYRADLGVGPLSMRDTPLESAPFGIPLPGATSLPQVAVEGPMQVVRLVTGDAVVAYNVLMLLGLVLTPLAAYLLCRHVSGSWWGGALGGLAYGFNPWIVEKAHGHIHFVHLWSLPLAVLGLVLVREGLAKKGWPLFAAAATVAVYTHTYFTLFVGAIVVGFCVVELAGAARAWTRSAVRSAAARVGLAAGITVAALIPQGIWLLAYQGRIDTALEGTRSRMDTYVYGSRWFEWVVPSYRHPIFDEWTLPFRAARLHGSNPGETSLYVGLTVIAVALLGVAVAVARRRLDPGRARAAMLAGVVLVVGLITSLPARITPLGIEIQAPADVIAGFFDAWRVYSRLFAVVDLALVVLAAIGVGWLVTRLGRRAGAIVALALAGLIAFDLRIDSVTFATEPPPVYDLLAEQPEGARVEYPLVGPMFAQHLLYIFYTEDADRPLMNGGKAETLGGSLNGRLSDPSKPWVPGALAALGVRYAVLHDAAAGPGATLPRRGFRLIGRPPGAALYEVTAAPAELMAAPARGFGAAEQQTDGTFQQWLQRPEGTLAILNRTDGPLRVRLSTRVSTFLAPRTLTVRQGERVLARKEIISATPVTVTAEAAPGITELTVTTDPAPVAIGSVLGNGDPRTVALQFGGIRVQAPGVAPFEVR